MACKHLHIVTTYTPPETGTVLALGFSKPVNTATDKERFCIKVCTTIPDTYDAYTVSVPINGEATLVYNKYGNSLIVEELKKCKVMKGYYGTVPSPHILLSDVPMSCNCGNV